MTAVKTVEYWFPALSSLPDNTLTALTQITAYLPEDSKTFVSVTLAVWATDITTASTETIVSRRVDCSVNGAGATSVTNTNSFSNSVENWCIFIDCDFTAHFAANWGTATSRTVDCSVLIDQTTATTLGWRNVCAKLSITYEYDETSATHVKTVWIPMDAPVGALATSKPGSPTDTIPALDTFCPEASKTYRQMSIVVQGNDQRTANTDATFSIEIDSAGAQSSNTYEGQLISSIWFLRAFPNQSWDTSTTHDFYIWGSIAQWNHLQVWLEVTYEFDLATTTEVLTSVWLPANTGNIMGGTTSSDYVSAVQDLWIEEPGTIANGRIAAYLYWYQEAPIAGLNARLGTGSFVTYTDSGGSYAGGSGMMIRNDSAFTLARGRNTLTLDIYRTDTVDIGCGLSGMFLVCYTSDVPAGGISTANKTVRFQTIVTGTAAPTGEQFSFAFVPIDMQSPQRFINGVVAICASLSNMSGTAIYPYTSDSAARTSRGQKATGAAIGVGDPEWGTNYIILAPQVQQWPTAISGIDPESATSEIGLSSSRGGAQWSWGLWVTYHGITFAVAGNVTGSAGGTVNLTLHRLSDGEQLASTSRSGDGAYTMTWYDDTEDVYVVGQEDATHVGASAPDTAA